MSCAIAASWWSILFLYLLAFVGVTLIKYEAPTYQGPTASIGYRVLYATICGFVVSSFCSVAKLVASFRTPDRPPAAVTETNDVSPT